MERFWKTVCGVLIGWCVLLSWYCYVVTRETQRMLCHTRWPQYSSEDCSTHFTGDTLTYLIMLGIGVVVALAIIIITSSIRANKDGDQPVQPEEARQSDHGDSDRGDSPR